MKFSAIILALILVAVLAVRTDSQEQVPSGRDVVSPSVHASFEPVARSSSFQLAVVLKIRPGFHINAREKSEDYLIATDLKADLPAGFQAGEVSYPKGKLHSFAFSKKPLNVYEDTVTLYLPLTALPTAPLGAQHIPLKLRYQACSTEICLPPVTLALDAALNVAASGAKPAHPELFPPAR
jgi:cytochrome c biogenesis DsbD-like protein